MQIRDLHPRRFFLEAWHRLDSPEGGRSARGTGRSEPQRHDALTCTVIFCVVAVSLTLQHYWGDEATFRQVVRFIDNTENAQSNPLLYALVGWLKPDGARLLTTLRKDGSYELMMLSYWAAWRVFGFLIIPLIAVALYPHLRFSQLGLSFAGMRRHLWVYGICFLPVFAAVVIVSFSKEFSSYYPFYSKAHETLFDFVVWELWYIAQFFSLELFFRGFMLLPLRRYMGASAIFAMMVPYCMIHYGKPMLECFGAIIAGVVLGTLAMRTRSIWAGFLLHVSIALSMDVLSIWQNHW